MPNIELGRAFQLYRKMQVWCEVIVLTSDSLSAIIHMHHKNCYYNDKNKRTSTKQYGMVALKKKKLFHNNIPLYGSQEWQYLQIFLLMLVS